MLLIGILFFLKSKFPTTENKIYTMFIVVAILGIVLDLAGIYAHLNLPETSLFRWLIVKLYLTYILTFGFLVSAYIGVLILNVKHADKSRYSKLFYFLGIIYLISLGINFALPFHYFNDGAEVYVYGLNTTFIWTVFGINIFFWIVLILAYMKKLPFKQLLPIITLLVIGLPIASLQFVYSELLLVTAMITFVVVFFYHTIENPDMQLIKELNIAKDIADKANNAKTDFLSNMSHEIRTPLNAIVGFSQTLAEEDLSDSARDEVNDIITASNNLLEIVNGILDISKIEANKLELINVEYSASTLFHEIKKIATIKLGEKPLEFNVNIDNNLPPVLYGDKLRIKQIIVNLVTNAIKYTKEGSVTLTVNSIIRKDVCRLIVAVEDTGIGIKPEDVNNLFQKFERFEIERNSTTEGTGLGLAITKSLVELMGGKIVVQTIYGEGSKFTVAFDQNISLKPANELQEIPSYSLPFLATGKRILVVDDNKINLKVANRLLRDYQAEVVLVSSAQECLDLILDGKHFDIILMDDMMPKMSGTVCLRHLKNINDFETPVVALTANAITGMRERYLALGFDDYMAKPIDQHHLNYTLRRFLNISDEQIIPQENLKNIEIEQQNQKNNLILLENNGINYQKSIELLGDMETYEDSLKSFCNLFNTTVEKIDSYRMNNDMENYAIVVHSLKSDAKYLGFTDLAELAAEHEQESKNNNQQYINNNYFSLMNELYRIYEVLNEYMNKGSD